MKKKVNIIAIFLILFLLLFTIKIYADSLDSIDITTTQETVHPGETVTLNVQFGKELGSYTVDVAYDNALLEYVSAEGGTPNDNGTRIRVYYYDSTGGSSPRNHMSVTFKAKEGIVTSNPTDLSVTAEGLANPDASVTYDDITIPIVKNIVVEPEYEDYAIALNYTGDIIKNEEKDMKLVISSAMGKNYEHTRIIGEVSTSTGGNAKLLATDEYSLEHDILQSGWGDASGDSIGGKDVVKELDVRGLFSESGDYTITLKLIDRDNSDTEIARESFRITVKTEESVTTPEQIPPTTTTQDNEQKNPSQTNETENKETNLSQISEAERKETPNTLPKTGHTIYFVIVPMVIVLIVAYICLKRKD